MYHRLIINQYQSITMAFAGIPVDVTSLDLSGNGLARKSTSELREAFSIIPTGVTTLNLSRNWLCEKTVAELRQIFAAIPRGVTTLDLSTNYLYTRVCIGLAAAIPIGVTSLDLSRNHLNAMSIFDLHAFVQAIPKHVTSIILRSNCLFTHKTPEKIDAFLAEFMDVLGRLDLSHNRQSEIYRAIIPLIQMDTSGVDGIDQKVTIPPEITANIASFLVGTQGVSFFNSIEAEAKAVSIRKILAAKITEEVGAIKTSDTEDMIEHDACCLVS